MGTNINVVLWTVAILVQLYILFTFIIRLFLQQPLIIFTILVAWLITWAYEGKLIPLIFHKRNRPAENK